MTDTSKILQDLEQAFFDIPFDNSDFQNYLTCVAMQITPARAYRAIGLRMSAKLRAIEGLRFSRRKEEVDVAELQATVDNPNSSQFAKQRAQIDIEEKASAINYVNKLLNDAIHELNFLYSEFKKYPAYTRAEFEMEELVHFQTSLSYQVQNALEAPAAIGALDSLRAISHFENIEQLIQEKKGELSIEHSSK